MLQMAAMSGSKILDIHALAEKVQSGSVFASAVNCDAWPNLAPKINKFIASQTANHYIVIITGMYPIGLILIKNTHEIIAIHKDTPMPCTLINDLQSSLAGWTTHTITNKPIQLAIDIILKGLTTQEIMSAA